jgi:ABC-2 type transport system permease protein
VLTPLTYFGGVVYSVAVLPEWEQRISYANPILYKVNAFRYGFFGHSDVAVGLAFTIMIIAAFAMFAFALHMLNRGTGIRE